MALVAIVTDTHFGARKGARYMQDHFEKFWTGVFFPTLKERGVTTILHMGDCFDSRKSIEYQSLDWAKRVVFDPMKEFDVHLITGNHDCYFKNTNDTNSPDLLLKDYENIKTYSKATEINVHGRDILMLPWICEENQKDTYAKIKKTKAKIALGHLELNGFKVNRYVDMDHGHDTKMFEKFEKVLSGHFHTRSNDGRIFYTGNPYEMFWNDVNDPRGFVLLDTETLEVEYVDNPHTLFTVINYDDINYKLFNATQCNDKIVKVVVKKKSSQKDFDKFIDKIMKTSIIDIKIAENFNVQESDDFDVDTAEENTLSILSRYIDEADFEESSLDKDSIKSLVSEIYAEACEV